MKHIKIQSHTHTTALLWLSGFCPGLPRWSDTRRNIQLTPILIINHPLSASSIYCNPWHPPCSVYVPDNLFCTISLQVFFGLPLGLAPSTSYSIHFFFFSQHMPIPSQLAVLPKLYHLILVPLSTPFLQARSHFHATYCFTHNCCTISLSLSMIDISLLVSIGTICLHLFHPMRLHSTCHLNNKTYPLTPDLHWHQY